MAVDGGAGDAELGGDLGDGEFACLVHLPRQPGLALPELGFLSPGPSTRPCGGEPVEGAFGHQGVFELGDGAEDLEEHPPDRGGGVDALVEHDQVDVVVVQLLGEVDELFQRPAEAVALGDHELVGGAQPAQRFVELGPAGELARRLVGEDALAAGGAECVGLGVGVLVAGGDPGVTDPHGLD